MAVDNSKTIDFIGLSRGSNSVVLTVSDHLEWDDSLQHQYVLQEKLNAYLAYIKSGEIFESYPESVGKTIKLEVVFLHGPDTQAVRFLEKVQRVIEEAGFFFSYRVGIDIPPSQFN